MIQNRPHVMIEIRRDPAEHAGSAEGLRVAVGLAAWEGLHLTLVWRHAALQSLALPEEEWEWRGIVGQHLSRLRERVPDWWAHPEGTDLETHADWPVFRPAHLAWVERCHQCSARLVF